jgi:hypothetical protein
VSQFHRSAIRYRRAQFSERASAAGFVATWSRPVQSQKWSGVLRTVRAGMLAVPSGCAARLPHLSAHDAAEIDREVRDVLSEIGST